MKRFLFIGSAALLLLASCGTTAHLSHPQQPAPGAPAFAPVMVRSWPQERPRWVDSVPAAGESIYFVGASHSFASESEARDAARKDASAQVVSYYGTVIRNQAAEKKSVTAPSADVMEPYIEREELLQSYAERYVSQILAEHYYTEQWQIAPDASAFRSWTLCSVPRQKVQDEIQSFADEVSARYAALLPERQGGTYTSVVSAVDAYLSVYRAVHANPVYQAVAYIDAAGGRAGLDDYALLQARRLIRGCTVEIAGGLPAEVERGQVLAVTFRVSSPDYPNAGGIGYEVTVSGGGIRPSAGRGTVGAEDAAVFHIPTKGLAPGTYRVQVTLAYASSGDVPGTVEGGTDAADFAVTPIYMGIAFDCSGELEPTEEVRRSITQALQDGMGRHGVPAYIDTDGTKGSAWRLLVLLDGRWLSGAEGVYKMRATGSVSLQKDGVALAASSGVSGSGLSKKEENSRAQAVAQCGNGMAGDGAFYAAMQQALGGAE